MIFIYNKYTRWYYNIIRRAQTRQLPKDIYIERHHIIPKSLGGTNSADNLVKLTAREHFICHLLLTKAIKPGLNQKMIHAAWTMTIRYNDTMNRYKVNSKTYLQLREKHAQAASVRLTGITRSEETKQKMRKPKSPEHAAKIVANSKKFGLERRGRPAHNKGIAGPMLGVPKSEEHKQKMRKPKTQASCIYCKKEGGVNQLRRWHFDNCKFKPLLKEFDLH